MSRIRDIDTDNDTMVVEAGCILQTAQQAARDADRLLPLSLAAEGSCTVGGNLGTNAGGTQVLRYGNARELAWGSEVVTEKTDMWPGMRGFGKEKNWYVLGQLEMGREGKQ